MKTYIVNLTEAEMKLFSEYARIVSPNNSKPISEYSDEDIDKEVESYRESLLRRRNEGDSNKMIYNQKEYAVKHYAPTAARNALAKKAWEMRRKVTPKALTIDKANRMIKAGYSGQAVSKAAAMDNKPGNGGLSLNDRLSRTAKERVRQEIAKERALLENKYTPKYTPDKFR